MATYTHGHHETVLRSHSSRDISNSAEYLRPYLTETTALLDVGAGPGSITAVSYTHLTLPTKRIV